MSNFKSGSGNLNFGESTQNDSDKEEDSTENARGPTESNAPTESASESSNQDSSPLNNPPASVSDESDSEPEQNDGNSTRNTYPYFVRRNNVGDERDTRLEIHVRDKVTDREAKFRNELADQLNMKEISKTDAREFALLAAFNQPEKVAELMKDEGFGALR